MSYQRKTAQPASRLPWYETSASRSLRPPWYVWAAVVGLIGSAWRGDTLWVVVSIGALLFALLAWRD